MTVTAKREIKGVRILILAIIDIVEVMRQNLQRYVYVRDIKMMHIQIPVTVAKIVVLVKQRRARVQDLRGMAAILIVTIVIVTENVAVAKLKHVHAQNLVPRILVLVMVAEIVEMVRQRRNHTVLVREITGVVRRNMIVKHAFV